jgi:hypothetical protein
MKKPPTKLWFLALAASLLAGAGTVFAQAARDDKDADQNPSHVQIGTSGNPKDVLLQKIGRAPQAAHARELYEEFLRNPQKYLKEDGKDLKKLAEAMKKGDFKLNADDPLVQQIRKALQQDDTGVGRTLSQEQRDNLKRLMEQFVPEQLPSPPTAGNGAPANGGMPAVNPPTPGGKPPGLAPMPPPVNPWDESGTSKWTRWLLRRSEDLMQWDGTLADSPALRQAVRDWDRYLRKGHDLRLGEEHATWAGRVYAAVRDSLPNKALPEGFLKKLNLKTPSLPQLKLSDVRLPDRSPGLSGTGLAAPSPSAMGLGVLWVAALVISGLILWRLYQARRRAAAAAGRQWKLGPWPVSPSALASRDDLVRAFEYLSFLQLGYTARSRNHLELAARLGGGVAERTRAAYHLARLYERARYAPESDALPPDALQSARRELCFLAGVTAV